MGNHHTPRIPPEWVLERIRECLAYDGTARSVIWVKGIKVGDRAGCVAPSGYILIQFAHRHDGEWYTMRAHHIVWYLHTGQWPHVPLDHRDCDRQNNNPDNLRLASSSKNIRNQRLRKDNQTGHKNIRFRLNRPKLPYQVRVRSDNKEVYCRGFATLDEAITARDKALLIHHGEFARTE